MDTPISVDSYDRPSVEKEPVSFENNFPSLGNGGVTVKPAATGPKPASPVVAWGNADVASIVAATPAPAGVKSELSVEPTEEDEEAAEIARLKALIPKLNQPKSHGKGMAAIRERSKSVSAAKLGVPAQQPSRASTFSKGPVSTRPSILSKPNQLSSALSNPLIISNRPKLRSTMKASPRAGNAFPQASRAASAENSSAEQGKESLPSDIAEASSSETSRGSSTNGEDLSDCDTHQSSPGMHPEPTKTVTASAEPEAIFPLETGGEQVGEHRALSNPWSSGSTSPSPGTSDSDIAHRENRPRSSSRELSSNDSDRSGSHPLSVTAPPTLVEETGFASPAPFSASKVGRIFPRPAPYESTFQYSASLEKEEQFLRTLGWDRSAYYDSDVDENEFVITQEEKEEFFKGYARLVDSADGGPSGPGRDASDCFGMGIGGAQVDPWGLRQQPLHQTRRYDVPAQSRHVRLLDPSGDSSPVGSPIGTRYPAVAVDSPTLIRRFTAF
ncbi:hypothetical protein HKX48_006023 [Thoreauomyces humboldtii]|nr:hypothetical protein HKX48_006023 [Thoreauomyces humboldtii]